MYREFAKNINKYDIVVYLGGIYWARELEIGYKVQDIDDDSITIYVPKIRISMSYGTMSYKFRLLNDFRKEKLIKLNSL